MNEKLYGKCGKGKNGIISFAFHNSFFVYNARFLVLGLSIAVEPEPFRRFTSSDYIYGLKNSILPGEFVLINLF